MRLKRKIIKVFCVLLALLMLAPAAGLAAPKARAASANELYIYNFLINEMKLNTAGACGVIANIKVESNFDPTLSGDGGRSFGICQWHYNRYAALVSFCQNNGLDYTSLEGQLRYLQYELQHVYTSTFQKLRSVPNTADGAYQAGYVWCYYFEVPSGYASGESVNRGNSAKYTYWPYYCSREAQLQEAAAHEDQNSVPLSAAALQAFAKFFKLVRSIMAFMRPGK